MLRGVVNAGLEAVVSLTVMGPDAQTREIDAVIDTGFVDYLTLPSDIVSELGLAFSGVLIGVLADGTEKDFQYYDVTVMWNDQPGYIRALVADATPLIGMALLHHHSLHVDVVEGGQVVIQPQS